MSRAPRRMTYDQALAYWHDRIDYERRAPVAGDLKLDRMRDLLGRLGHPHRRSGIVHVTGSKGKGSTSAMLAAILSAAGHRTGLFTSPHLVRLEERFRIDGRDIEPDALARLMSEIRVAVDALAGHPSGPVTFFELATALGFLHFSRQRCAFVVLEVGLGGRLDSTNVCTPELSIITSVSLDHTRILGDTVEAIAREKAGIIKPGRPAISGVTAEGPRKVIEEAARENGSKLLQLGRDFSVAGEPGAVGPLGVRKPVIDVFVHDDSHVWEKLTLNLLGRHQADNAALAVMAVEVLRDRGKRISDEAVRGGLSTTVWPGRMEVFAGPPRTVVDCAHNVASAQALAATLAESFTPGPRSLLFAGSADKDVPGMFAVLAKVFERAVFTRYVSNPRAIPPEQLLAWWEAAGGRGGETSTLPDEGLRRARQVTPAGGLLCVTGSVFLVGEVRPLLGG